MYKEMCNVVHRKLVHMVEENSWYSGGARRFQEGKSMQRPINDIGIVGQLKAVLERGMFVSFIDFKKAYDRVDQGKLWGCL